MVWFLAAVGGGCLIVEIDGGKVEDWAEDGLRVSGKGLRVFGEVPILPSKPKV